MSIALPRRRAALALALAFGSPFAGTASASTPPAPTPSARARLRLATGALPPLAAGADGRPGFLDELARAWFDRLGIDASVLRLPVERALINADAGIEDGDMFRAPGFEAGYPNLVQIPEKVLDFDFVAHTVRADLQVRGWDDLAPLGVA